MKDYFRSREHFIKQVRFSRDECFYSGEGIMAWNPESGFHIAARVRRDEPLPSRKDFRAISLDRGVLLRMELDWGVRCIVPNVTVGDLSLMNGRLSVNSSRAIFIQARESRAASSSWFGDALYVTRSGLVLPDLVRRETRIGDRQPILGESLSGLDYEDDSGLTIVGKLTDDKYLDVNWQLPKTAWAKTDNWQFATGLRDAVSAAAGEAVQLVYHRSYRHARVYTEMRAEEEVRPLGLLFRPFDQDVLDKDMIVRLASFLTRGSNAGDICRKMFYQMADASRQKTWQAKELLLSTILEASLRTLYGYPFDPDGSKRSDSFRVDNTMKRFREDYLSSTVELGKRWKKVIRRIIEIHKRLRHRNAHPDWISDRRGAHSPERMEQSLNDVIFLSRFYGYMILALAGFNGMEPMLPKPFDEWNPMLTMQRVEKKDTKS